MTETRVTSETGGQKGVKSARFELIDTPWLWDVAEVCGFGAEKYDDDNWRKGYDWKLTYGALNRHLSQFWMRQDRDDESGLPHLAHAAWHTMVLHRFSSDPQYSQYDSRPDVRSN